MNLLITLAKSKIVNIVNFKAEAAPHYGATFNNGELF